MLTYLKDLVKFLFFEHSVFEVDCDFLLLLRKHHAYILISPYLSELDLSQTDR